MERSVALRRVRGWLRDEAISARPEIVKRIPMKVFGVREASTTRTNKESAQELMIA